MKNTVTNQFNYASRRFFFMIVGLSIFSSALLALALYESSAIRFGDSISNKQLHSLVKDDPIVAEYLVSEEKNQAHFVAIANLIKEDQQQAISQAFLLVTGPVIVVSASIGYFVARYLLRPVRESYASQERFLQDAAHEMRNPLAAISLATENARAKSITPNEFLHTVSRQTSRLVQINEDLLYLERQTPELTLKSVNISELLEDVLEDFQPIISQKQLVITRKITPDINFKITADDFVKITKNLIDNAIKYTPNKGSILVSLTYNKQVLLKIKDSGIGITEADLPHIGERFYRAKNSAGIDGTGLGVAIVQKIIDTYNGQIKISSKKNSGTAVEVRF